MTNSTRFIGWVIGRCRCRGTILAVEKPADGGITLPAGRAVVILFAILGIANCSGSEESGAATKDDRPSPKEPAAAVVRPAVPDVESKELLETMQQLVAAYNKGSFVVASRYIDDNVIARCGGAQNYALASRRNSQAEQLTYSVERADVTGGTSDRLEADVYYSSKDVRTGAAVDVNQANGLTFSRSNRPDIRWVLGDAFPLGVAGYCR